MKASDRVRFVSALVALAELYQRTLSEGVIGLYWQALASYDIAAVEKGIGACLTDPDHGQWMPKPADIIRHIDGGKADAALVAWAKVDAAVRRVGPYASVTFDDSIAMAVLSDMGGWIALASKKDDDWPFVAKEFENRYRGYKVRTEPYTHPPVLLGMNDLENVRRGYPSSNPVFVGDPAKCRLVYQQGSEVQRLSITAGDITQATIARLANKARAS